LERIGRRLLNQGHSAEKIYSTLKEVSEAKFFSQIDDETLEEIAIDSKNEGFETVEKEIEELREEHQS